MLKNTQKLCRNVYSYKIKQNKRKYFFYLRDFGDLHFGAFGTRSGFRNIKKTLVGRTSIVSTLLIRVASKDFERLGDD